jgi:hypothetical protein
MFSESYQLAINISRAGWLMLLFAPKHVVSLHKVQSSRQLSPDLY